MTRNKHQLLIIKGIERIVENIDQINNQFVRGLLRTLLIILVLIIIIGFFLIGFFVGHWLRNVIILGIWFLIELIYFAGR
tara:strand:- start:830 stop:1069 length:240 start_codon:yes stop_codon:yes gene_type:complete